MIEFKTFTRLKLQTGRNNSVSCSLSGVVMEFIWQAAVALSSSRRDQLQWLKNKTSIRCSSFNSISFLHISNENRDQSLNEGININVIIVKPQRTDLAHLCDFFFNGYHLCSNKINIVPPCL